MHAQWLSLTRAPCSVSHLPSRGHATSLPRPSLHLQPRTCTLTHLSGHAGSFYLEVHARPWRAALTHAGHNHDQRASTTNKSERQRVAFSSIIRSYVIALLNRCFCLQLHARGRNEHDMAPIEIMTRRVILGCCFVSSCPIWKNIVRQLRYFEKEKQKISIVVLKMTRA
ncbi:hypothetical protein FVEG_15368 [Fusarium verticillioides 7600]|uniref:Uncharacterized protein n=1 Tax=Gibberella moniliformis (strain M3125 / FGSC 7600) TaxID=334819 RepID=W7LTU2_GIBM7|nr:hypothetical protein FVEG_15368 [Fusarium verticillioides 7600]EWG41976.1 hypothetical protein FVEG_15368 [Fusarium verticillioides 7600]